MYCRIENLGALGVKKTKNIGIYLYSGSKMTFTGVENKINNQIEVLGKHWETKKIVIEKEKSNIFKSIVWRLPFGSWGEKYEEAIAQIEKAAREDHVKFFYIRSQLFDRKYISFLRDIRRKYTDSKIMLEMPTYPFNMRSLGSKTMWPWYFKHVVNRNRVSKYVDRIVTYSDDDIIFGVPTIKTSNGIIVDQFCPEYSDNREDSDINLIAVAQFQRGHGYERIIEALHRYYCDNPSSVIKLHMVGDGAELQYYKRLTTRFRLNEYVMFYGMRTGDELKKIYARADIALGCFGDYKNNLFISSALKTREYLAYGLPIVSACHEDAFDSAPDCDFYKEFPNDSSDIDMQDILSFYNGLMEKYSISELRTRIHEYAVKNVDMEITMKDIVEYIDG